MIEKVLNINFEKNSEMQVNSIKELMKIFILSEIGNFVMDNYTYQGVRGNYEGKNNYMLHFTFLYLDHLFEFFISYDQLEYYIQRGNKTIKECNLEDFWKAKVMVQKYISCLKRDLEVLNIKIQNQ